MVRAESAYPPRAAASRTCGHPQLVPLPDLSRCSKPWEDFYVSLDDFVGEQQERIRDIESHRLGSLEVHDQFVACGQLEGQLTRLRTLENFIYQSGRLAVHHRQDIAV